MRLEHEVNCRGGNLIEGSPDRRQWDGEQACQGDVVVADQRYVVADAQAVMMGGGHDANREVVVGGEDGGGPGTRRKEASAGFHPVFDAEACLDDELGVRRVPGVGFLRDPD